MKDLGKGGRRCWREREGVRGGEGREGNQGEIGENKGK